MEIGGYPDPMGAGGLACRRGLGVDSRALEGGEEEMKTTGNIEKKCRNYLESCKKVMYKQESPSMMTYAAERLRYAADFAKELGLITVDEWASMDYEVGCMIAQSREMKSAPGSGNSGGAQE